MTKRPHISTALKVRIAILQAANNAISCGVCRLPLGPFDDRILEHMVPHEFGGSSDERNLRWVHKACADRKTYGYGATAADGDTHKIAKAKRLASGGRKSRRPMRKHPTLKRTVGGKVVER
jgi:hypothetical protein